VYGGRFMSQEIKENNNKDKRPDRLEGEDNILGNRLRVLRKKRGLSLAQLAKLLGKTKTAVVSYEQGYRFPLLRDIDTLAEELGTSVGYLIGETDISGPPVTGEKIEDSLKYTLEQLSLGELIKTGDIHNGEEVLSNEQLKIINEYLRKVLNGEAELKINNDDEKA